MMLTQRLIFSFLRSSISCSEPWLLSNHTLLPPSPYRRWVHTEQAQLRQPDSPTESVESFAADGLNSAKSIADFFHQKQPERALDHFSQLRRQIPLTTAHYNAMIDGYFHSRLPDDACAMFASMSAARPPVPPDLATFHILCSNYTQLCRFNDALDALAQIHAAALSPSLVSYNHLLNIFFSSSQPAKAVRFWQEIKPAFSQDRHTGPSSTPSPPSPDDAFFPLPPFSGSGVRPAASTLMLLMRGFCSACLATEASEVFALLMDVAPTRGLSSHDYTGLLAAFIQANDAVGLRAMFHHIRAERTKLPASKYRHLLRLAHTIPGSKMVDLVLEHAKAAGFGKDVQLYNARISNQIEMGAVEQATALFEEMQEQGVSPNNVTYTSMIDGYFQHKHSAEAVDILLRLQDGNNLSLSSSSSSTLSTTSSDSSQNLNMLHYYSKMIQGFFQVGEIQKATETFEKLKVDGPSPDRITYNIVIQGCMNNYMIGHAFRLLDEMIASSDRNLHPDESTYITMIIGMSKHPDEGGINRLMNRMRRQAFPPTIAVYNSLILTLFRLQQPNIAEQVFEQILFAKMLPNRYTYTIMIDGYFKSLSREKAEQTYLNMKQAGFHPTCITYNVLLSGHFLAGDILRVEEIYREMLEQKITPERVTYLILHSGYKKHGFEEKATMIARIMKRRGFSPPSEKKMNAKK